MVFVGVFVYNIYEKVCVRGGSYVFSSMVDLSAMEVLVVGGGRIAYRKVKKLLDLVAGSR